MSLKEHADKYRAALEAEKQMLKKVDAGAMQTIDDGYHDTVMACNMAGAELRKAYHEHQLSETGPRYVQPWRCEANMKLIELALEEAGRPLPQH